MKRIVLATAAALMITMGAMAQDEPNGAMRPERRQMNQTEMIQHRTQRTVEQYGLTKEQGEKLLELNTKFAGKLGGPRPGFQRGMRQGGPGRQGMHKHQANRDSLKREMPSAEEMNKMRQQQQEAMADYEKELQTIMTEEQFKAYKADTEKRMKEGRRGFRGERPHKNNDNK